jgi:hypothetical protein
MKKQKFLNILFWVLFVGSIVFRTWLFLGIPKTSEYGPMDDLFYAKATHYLIHGEWMGPYSELTLIKAPFYSFFIVASFLSGLPLMLNETIFFILACVLMFIAIKPLVKNEWLRILIVFGSLFSPSSLATVWNLRVYREFIYFSVTLYVLAFSCGFFIRLKQPIETLIHGELDSVFRWALLCFPRRKHLDYPVMFLFLLSCGLFIWKRISTNKLGKTLLTFSIVVIWYVPILIVSFLNYSNYGFWGITETTDKDFTRVLNALSSIKTSQWYPYSPVTKESFEKAYAVSPLLNGLKDQIDELCQPGQDGQKNSYRSTPTWYRENMRLIVVN